LPLQQDFYSKSGHASPQNSSQIYAYAQSMVANLLRDVFWTCMISSSGDCAQTVVIPLYEGVNNLLCKFFH